MYLFLTIFIIFIDQITKYFAVDSLKDQSSINIIGDFFKLVYVENSGAAFGILKDNKLFFIIITTIILLIMFIYSYKNWNKFNKSIKLLFSMFVGGTIGNFIDRVRLGYVVDFFSFDFGFYSFPVFNIADIAITVSVFVFAFLVFTNKVEF